MLSVKALGSIPNKETLSHTHRVKDRGSGVCQGRTVHPVACDSPGSCWLATLRNTEVHLKKEQAGSVPAASGDKVSFSALAQQVT